MFPGDLRHKADSASRDYVRAQYILLDELEKASRGLSPWPCAERYAKVTALGKAAFDALRRYLNSVGVAKVQRRSADERMRLIEKLSTDERLWQPLPEDWLKRIDQDPSKS